MTNEIGGTEYVNSIHRDYSLYVLYNRAISSMCDGLKPAARRVLWMARDGAKYKSATLAGITMPIHPHAAPESTINTLAAEYGNNYPLLTGYGAFGTLVAPDAFGASRYTSVTLSQFAKDALMTDIDIIPMQENYDSSLTEPVHFLPIVPLGLLNPSEGIAIGYASNILPRKLKNVVDSQIKFLNQRQSTEPAPHFVPLNQTANLINDRWVFEGTIERVNSTSVRITSLPYGVTHSKIVTNENSKLSKLLEDGVILDYIDSSKKTIDVLVKFKRQTLAEYDDQQLMQLFGLRNAVSENLTVLNLTHNAVMQPSFQQYIELFTQWRLSWYVLRYKRLIELANHELSKYADILIAIEHGINTQVTKLQDKQQLCQWLQSIGVIGVEYIATLPTYRFTQQETLKAQKKLIEIDTTIKQYQSIVDSDVARKEIYEQELTQLLSKYK